MTSSLLKVGEGLKVAQSDIMSDKDFLNYCESHSYTPRCGFIPAQMVRLYNLAGDHDGATLWALQPNGVYSCNPVTIRQMVTLAKQSVENPSDTTVSLVRALNYVADMTYCGADAEWHFKIGYDPQVVLDALVPYELDNRR